MQKYETKERLHRKTIEFKLNSRVQYLFNRYTTERNILFLNTLQWQDKVLQVLVVMVSAKKPFLQFPFCLGDSAVCTSQ